LKFFQRFQVFVVRPLSADMDLTVYDKMLQVQGDPRFAKYFAHSNGTNFLTN
jgi:hypothetical protein